MHKARKKYLLQVKKRITHELAIPYHGTTDNDLEEFVRCHVRKLPIKPERSDPDMPTDNDDVFYCDGEFFKYVELVKEIEDSKGIRFKGSTDEEMKNFVKLHIRDLPNYAPKKQKRPKPKKYKPVKAAAVKPKGLFRKHGDKDFKPLTRNTVML